MLTLVDRIRELSNKKGMSLPQLEITLGLGNGTISRWKNSSPNTDKLQKVADYFNVSMDYLLGRDSILTSRDNKDIAKDLDRIMAEIRKGDDGPLYYDGVEIDEKSLILLENAIEHALRETKKENKVKYNPYKNKK